MGVHIKVWPQYCPLKFIGNIEKCEFKNAYGCAYKSMATILSIEIHWEHREM